MGKCRGSATVLMPAGARKDENREMPAGFDHTEVTGSEARGAYAEGGGSNEQLFQEACQ